MSALQVVLRRLGNARWASVVQLKFRTRRVSSQNTRRVSLQRTPYYMPGATCG